VIDPSTVPRQTAAHGDDFEDGAIRVSRAAGQFYKPTGNPFEDRVVWLAKPRRDHFGAFDV
jgi:hypothetical protein